MRTHIQLILMSDAGMAPPYTVKCPEISGFRGTDTSGWLRSESRSGKSLRGSQAQKWLRIILRTTRGHVFSCCKETRSSNRYMYYGAFANRQRHLLF
jgi:hypothetical protein